MLKLSKKWWYAMKAMTFIAKSEKLVHVSDVASAESISESLLRRIISDLEKGGLVETIKWRNGWVKLWKEIQKITVYDILYSVGEELGLTECTKGEYCDRTAICSTTEFLGKLQTWFNSLLKMYTLDKIIK